MENQPLTSFINDVNQLIIDYNLTKQKNQYELTTLEINYLNDYFLNEKKQNIDNFLKYKFKYSQILNCSLNNQPLYLTSFKSLLTTIYDMCEKQFILDNTKIRIIEGKYSKNSWYYEKYDISIIYTTDYVLLKNIINMVNILDIQFYIYIIDKYGSFAELSI
jgi:hypothetical protein